MAQLDLAIRSNYGMIQSHCGLSTLVSNSKVFSDEESSKQLLPALVETIMINRFPGREFLLFLLLVALAGAALIVYSDSIYGPALSNDSVQYISIARNLAADGRFVSYLPGPVTKWPPLYPVLLAIGSQVFGVDALYAAGYLNALFFSLLIGTAGFLAAITLDRPYYLAILATLLVSTSAILITIAVFAWTETLFIAMSLLFLIGLLAYIESGRVSWLALMIISAALACLTRYMGFTLVIAGIGTLLLFQRRRFLSRMKAVLIFAFFSSLPLGLWLFRNYLISDNLAGNRVTISGVLGENIRLTATHIVGWFRPGEVTSLTVIIGIAFGAVIAWNLYRSRELSSATWREMGPVIVYILSYLAGLLVVNSLIALPPIEHRFLSPVLVPVTVLVLYFAKRLLMSMNRKELGLVASVTVFSGGIILLLPSISFAVSETRQRITIGAGGLNRLDWRESETAMFLRENPQLAARTIFTNAPDAAYILGNVDSLYLPAKKPDSEVAKNELAEMTGQWPAKVSYLLWFNGRNRTWMYTLEELLSIVEVLDETRFKDGVIYTIGRGQSETYERSFASPEPDTPTDIHWGDKISLLGYEMHRDPNATEVLSIRVYWQARATMERAYVVFFHVMDPETGELVAQSDVMPRGWSYPTSSWIEGEIIEDTVKVDLFNLSSGQYELRVGWYDPETGVRLPATAETNRETVDDSTFLVVIEK